MTIELEARKVDVEDIKPRMWARLGSGREVQVLEVHLGLRGLEFLCVDWENQAFNWWDPDYIQPWEQQ